MKITFSQYISTNDCTLLFLNLNLVRCGIIMTKLLVIGENIKHNLAMYFTQRKYELLLDLPKHHTYSRNIIDSG
jgi:hypothetical protein